MTYSFRAAYEAEAFQQLHLLSEDDFGRAAKARGVNLSFGPTLRRRLEELDRSGALRPIAFATKTLYPPGPLTFREEVDFVPWKNYEVDDQLGGRRPRAFYAHWQLLYIKEALELATAPVQVDWLLDVERRKELSHFFRQFYEEQRARRQGLDDAWRPLMLLLVRLQNRYFPVIRGTLTKVTTTPVYDPEVGDYVSPFRTIVEDFDPQAVLDELGLSRGDVTNLHKRLGIQGVKEDPLERFYMLFRMAPYQERSKLEGQARQAQDAYDAAEMLRRFYWDLSGGELLKTPDEIFDGTVGAWKEHWFGHGPRLGFTPEDLQVELTRHHLYPHTVHLVVEGESDEYLLRGLLEDLAGPVGDLGVSFSTLKGIGRARLHAEVLRAARRYARFPILVADREGNIERDVALMKNEGLLNDETAILWERSLEEDNFSDEELVGRPDVEPAQAVKTLVHELAHALLHGEELPTSRNVAEVEVESVAYIVCDAIGLDTSEYSFAYVARWSDGLSEFVKDTAERVIECAKGLLDSMVIDSEPK